MTVLSLLLLYSLYLSAGLAVMYGALRLCKVDSMLRGRRAILLSVTAAVIAAGIPLLTGWLSRLEVTLPSYTATLTPLADVAPETPATTETREASTLPSVWTMLMVVYAVGAIIALGRLTITIARIQAMARDAEEIGDICVLEDNTVGPFSWGGRIFMNRADYESDSEILMTHEGAHRDACHWVDLLYINLLDCLTWYCPAARGVLRMLQGVHEYEADRAVLDAGFDARSYQMLLIAKASGKSLTFTVADCISNPPLKNRILMMKSPYRQQPHMSRLLALIPVAAALCAVASLPAIASNAASLMPARVTVEAPVAAETPAPAETTAPTQGAADSEDYEIPEMMVVTHKTDIKTDTTDVATDYDNRIFDTVEQAPEFPGGMDALMRLLASNLRYPKECHERGIEGRSIVRFVVKADGSIGDVTVVRSADPQLDGEAVRLVRMLPDFEPGRMNGHPVNVYFTLPVVFRVSKDECPIPAEANK